MRAFIFLLALMAACAPVRPHVDDRDVESRAEQLHQLARARTVQIVQGPYLGAIPVEIREQELPAVFSRRVTLRGSGTIEELTGRLASILNMRVRVDNPPAAAGPDMAPGREPGAASGVLSVRYDGPVSGLLDTLSSRSGLGWEYERETGQVVFSRVQSRVFTLLTAPGKVRYESDITNRSRGAQSSSQSISGVGQTVNSSNDVHRTSQTSRTTYEADAWADAEKDIRAMLSPAGVAVANRSAGTVMVTDTRAVLHRVESYVTRINAKLSRQVALAVRVWAIEVADDSDLGLDLQAAFKDANLQISTTPGSAYNALDGVGSLSAAIVNKSFSGSQAVLQALRRVGRTTLVTSSTGITMSNQPMPIQVMDRNSYLASVSSTTDDYGKTTEMTPGEVSTGFAMTVVPHILDGRRVILQYNVSLSSLDKLDEFASGDTSIQLPQISTRSFSQRVRLKMGQTLVLAGFEKEKHTRSGGASLLSMGRSRQVARTVLVITIDVENPEA
ncbi:type II secretory pathway component PulD-like protein [Pseudodesulfovibrio tunisiensis]|uniref:type II secretory pathway component PulD-like protein n=1 Tax=Pseudodesulfovibrio tunisiensis TaxID=463192 RepID=UPI001FB2272A|nr:type II secretory pathway component PulD-like protein [Pseudodesulfovibrio tunisiensis]